MNTTIVGRHVTIDENTRKFIEEAAKSFDKFHLDIISISAIASKEEAHKRSEISFEFVLNIANLDTIVVKQKDQSLMKAVETASQRVTKILRRHHDKIKSHDATKLTKAFDDKETQELENIDKQD